jgi:soluble lytic murein transglycosylase-like protein
VFAFKPNLVAMGAAGILALGVGASAAAQSPADGGRAGDVHVDRTSWSAQAPRIARYDQAHRATRPSRGDDSGAPQGSGAQDAGYASPESYGVSQATLDAIAACESGGDPTAVSADGTYRGKYQFDYGTWASVGGSGDPAAAPEAEQDMRAAMLYSQSGSSPWPICG